MSTKKGKVIKVSKIVLKVIGAAGFVSMAVMAPNALQSLEMFGLGNKRKRYGNFYINNTISRLEKRGLVEVKDRYGEPFVRLTKKGQRELLRYQMQDKMVQKPKRWDKKWRVIIFDIEEQARNLREGLRKELINLGFVKLQNSVWVYPYECEDVIGMLKLHLDLWGGVLYMVVEKIEDDEWLRREFDLA